MAFTPNPILQQKTQNRQVDDLQRSYVQVFNQLQDLAPLNGVYLSSFTLAPSATVAIAHNMGRPYQGWQICRMRYVSGAAASPFIVEVAQTDTAITSSVLQLQYLAGTATVTFDVWVY